MGLCGDKNGSAYFDSRCIRLVSCDWVSHEVARLLAREYAEPRHHSEHRALSLLSYTSQLPLWDAPSAK